jgi:hypothetical protein
MKIEVDIPEYSSERGLCWPDEEGAAIAVVVSGNTVEIAANPAGLIALGRYALGLAQPGVPKGHHQHLDSFHTLEEGSNELLILRM